jgi:Domain of unknown function (DUF1707)
MCHPHHHRYEREPERVATPAPPSGPVRVGDADRERVAALLRDHAAAGRLEPDELEERLGRVYAARYGSDLEAALAELPPEHRAARPVRPEPRRAAPVLPLAIGALIALAAVTGAWWLMWLIWPIVMVLGPRRRYRRAPF